MYCPKCGVQNADGMNFCGSCGNAMNSRPPQAAVPVYATRVKKRKWPWILVGIVLLSFIILQFLPDGEEEMPDYGNTFAPSQIQGGSSSQFSAALDSIREGGGFEGYAGSQSSASGGNSNDYGDIYAELYNWTDEDWEEFWDVMLEYLDDDDIEYIASLDEDELIDLIIEILNDD